MEEDKYVVNVVKADFDLLIHHYCTHVKFNVVQIQSNCIILCFVNVSEMDKEMNRFSV